MKADFGMALRRGISIFLLAALAFLHCAGRISFVTADLGRHLKNGEFFLANHNIFSTNFYSFTYPDFFVPCHHWGSGVLFYLVWKPFGFVGLSLLYTALLVMTLFFFVWTAARSSRFWPAMLMAVLALPLIGYRIEIRPEGLTTFFLGISFLILTGFRSGRLSERWLWTLPLVQFLWINSHVFFFLGLFLIAVFAFDEVIRHGWNSRWKAFFWVGIVSLTVSFLNPTGLAGVLQPLTIFKNYGYELAENQSIFFMMKRFPGTTTFPYFLGFLAFSGVLLFLRFIREEKLKNVFLPFLLFVVFGLMVMKSVRLIAMSGLVLIPLTAESFVRVADLYFPALKERIVRGSGALALASLIVALTVPYFYLSPVKKFSQLFSADEARYKNSYFYILAHPQLWAGLPSGTNASADFFRDAGLKGPIFNNYDIGGYLIFYFFPHEKVFVDNRPEAYPASFFKEVYIPMQEDEASWQKVDEKHKFQVVYFFRRDMTPWGQAFLIRRAKDEAWVPVFVDDFTIIFVKRGGVNQSVADRYELPRSIFRVTGQNPN